MLTRRDLLKLGVLGGSAALFARTFPNLISLSYAGHLEPFSLPLPIPTVLQPLLSEETGDYYELTMNTGLAQLRDGPATEIWGFDGQWPGPTIRATRGRPVHVHATNLMSRDTNIHNHGHKVPV